MRWELAETAFPQQNFLHFFLLKSIKVIIFNLQVKIFCKTSSFRDRGTIGNQMVLITTFAIDVWFSSVLIREKVGEMVQFSTVHCKFWQII